MIKDKHVERGILGLPEVCIARIFDFFVEIEAEEGKDPRAKILLLKTVCKKFRFITERYCVGFSCLDRETILKFHPTYLLPKEVLSKILQFSVCDSSLAELRLVSREFQCMLDFNCRTYQNLYAEELENFITYVLPGFQRKFPGSKPPLSIFLRSALSLGEDDLTNFIFQLAQNDISSKVHISRIDASNHNISLTPINNSEINCVMLFNDLLFLCPNVRSLTVKSLMDFGLKFPVKLENFTLKGPLTIGELEAFVKNVWGKHYQDWPAPRLNISLTLGCLNDLEQAVRFFKNNTFRINIISINAYKMELRENTDVNKFEEFLKCFPNIESLELNNIERGTSLDLSGLIGLNTVELTNICGVLKIPHNVKYFNVGIIEKGSTVDFSDLITSAEVKIGRLRGAIFINQNLKSFVYSSISNEGKIHLKINDLRTLVVFVEKFRPLFKNELTLISYIGSVEVVERIEQKDRIIFQELIHSLTSNLRLEKLKCRSICLEEGSKLNLSYTRLKEVEIGSVKGKINFPETIKKVKCLDIHSDSIIDLSEASSRVLFEGEQLCKGTFSINERFKFSGFFMRFDNSAKVMIKIDDKEFFPFFDIELLASAQTIDMGEVKLNNATFEEFQKLFKELRFYLHGKLEKLKINIGDVNLSRSLDLRKLRKLKELEIDRDNECFFILPEKLEKLTVGGKLVKLYKFAHPYDSGIWGWEESVQYAQILDDKLTLDTIDYKRILSWKEKNGPLLSYIETLEIKEGIDEQSYESFKTILGFFPNLKKLSFEGIELKEELTLDLRETQLEEIETKYFQFKGKIVFPKTIKFVRCYAVWDETFLDFSEASSSVALWVNDVCGKLSINRDFKVIGENHWGACIHERAKITLNLRKLPYEVEWFVQDFLDFWSNIETIDASELKLSDKTLGKFERILKCCDRLKKLKLGKIALKDGCCNLSYLRKLEELEVEFCEDKLDLPKSLKTLRVGGKSVDLY